MPTDIETAETDPANDPSATTSSEAAREPATSPPSTDAPDVKPANEDEPSADAEDAKPGGVRASAAKGVDGDEASADATEDAGASRKKGGRLRGVRGVPLRAGVVLLLVAAVVTAGLQWYRAERAAGEDAARRAVERQAGEFGQALLSYDHEHLQDARNRVLALASDDFAKTYDVAFTGGLESVITKLKADASATVRAVYLGDVDESTARAIVVLDSEVRSSAGTRRVLGSHLDMRLVRKDGEWRVTEVTSIGAAQETMTDPQGRRQGGEGVVPTPEASPGE